MGFSPLIHKAIQSLDNLAEHTCISKPISLSLENIDSLGSLFVQEIKDFGFSNQDFKSQNTLDITSTFYWIIKNSSFRNGQRIVFPVEVENVNNQDISKLARLFSNARNFEGGWDSSELSICIIFISFWNSEALKKHYRDQETSLPFTSGVNQVNWIELNKKDFISNLSSSNGKIALSKIDSEILYEISGGIPTLAAELLESLQENDFSILNLVNQTKSIAHKGLFSKKFTQQISGFTNSIKTILSRILIERYLSNAIDQEIKEQLLLSCCIREQKTPNSGYVTFFSWAIELILRAHETEIGISSEKSQRIEVSELQPEIFVINIEAYKLIFSIEFKIRNLIFNQLCLLNESDHYLKNWLSGQLNGYNDAYSSANDWKNKSNSLGLSMDLNSLLCYLNTRDAAKLMKQLGSKIDNQEWIKIGQKLLEVSSIRDAVMHNQIIDKDDFNRLEFLNDEIDQLLAEIRI
jgi:hypothetical protein